MKRSVSKVNIFILTLILGLMIVMQYKITKTGTKYVSFKDIETQVIQIESQEVENKILSDQVIQLENQIKAFKDAINENGDIESVLRDEIEKYRLVVGIDDVSGPGVVIIVTDSDRALLENEDPNNLLVHDLDIQALIDDLMLAGAEAIAVNGQRVLPNFTEVVCNGPTVRVNEKMYSQPFIIEAIGDRNYLKAAINAPDQYGQVLRQWGIFLEVNTSIYLEISGYDLPIQFKYMKPKEN